MLDLNAAIIGEILLASKVIDAFTDIYSGYLIDKTHTKIGKARPYEVFILGEWILTIMLFSTPNFGSTMQYIWVFIIYVLINAVCVSVLGASDSVYMARAFSTESNRMKAMSVSGFLVMIISIIFTTLIPQFIDLVGTKQSGWTMLATSIAVPMAVIGILRFVFVKEVVDDSINNETSNTARVNNDITMKKSFKALTKNKYLFIIVGLVFIYAVINNFGTANTYYFKYIVGDIGKMSLMSMTSLITPFVLIVYPSINKRLGSAKVLRIFSICGVAGVIIRIIGGTNMATIMIGTIGISLANVPIGMMINNYVIECMDYGEWKTGVRVEGLVAAATNFSNKLGGGVTLAILGFIMSAAGYNGEAKVQSASALTAINGVFNWIPLVFFILMFLLSMAYRMDKIRPQMMADLKKKHEME
ncbi:MAG: MFS transporter [Liquorilactobacillus ghanensis]|uniref:MFS transporter n=1 Tax=Liquorilactobacillus ghanensis TaxID=399370 RepID=UPI0039ED0AA1